MKKSYWIIIVAVLSLGVFQISHGADFGVTGNFSGNNIDIGNVANRLPLNTPTTDLSNSVDIANDNVLIVDDGFYLFEVSATINDISTTNRVYSLFLKRNGSQFQRNCEFVTIDVSTFHFNCSWSGYLTAGDTIDFFVVSSADTSDTLHGGLSFYTVTKLPINLDVASGGGSLTIPPDLFNPLILIGSLFLFFMVSFGLMFYFKSRI